MHRVCLKVTCCMFIAVVSIWNVSLGTGRTSGFINNMNCLKKENENVQCITSKFEDNSLTENGINTLIPADAKELHIFCLSLEVNKIGAKLISFERLTKLELLKFWSCKFDENPYLKFRLPGSVRSLELQNSFLRKRYAFSSTSVLCDKVNVKSIASTHQFGNQLGNQHFFGMDKLLDCSETGCCRKLLSLNISFNFLSHESFEQNAFHGLDSLEILDLRFNNFKYLGDGLFSKLKSLKTIILAGNFLLTTLHLHEFGENYQLSDLILDNEYVTMDAPDLIKPFQNLERVPTSYCPNYVDYNIDKFSFLRNIKSLCIGDSIRSMFTPYFFSTESISKNMMNLSSLYLRTEITKWHSDVFSTSPHLRYLSIRSSKFKLDDLASSLFSGLNLLETLDVRYCKWIEGNRSSPNGHVFKNMQNLKRIDLIRNGIRFLSDNFFDDLNQIEFVNLQGNKLDAVPWCLCHRKNSWRLHELDLNGNDIEVLQEHDFKNCGGLVIVAMARNRLKFVGSNSSTPFRYLTKLNSLVLANNQIQHFDYYMIPNSLEYLDLSRNRISFLNDERNVINSIKLKIFLMRENNLKYLESTLLPSTLTQIIITPSVQSDDNMQLEKFTFDNFPHLEIFIIEANFFNLSRFHNKMFSNFWSVNGTYFEFPFFYNQICPQRIDRYDINNANNINILQYLPSLQTFPHFHETSARYSFCTYTQDCNQCTNENLQHLVSHFNVMFRTLDCSKRGLDKFPSLESIVDLNELFLDGNNIREVNAYSRYCFESLSKVFLNSSHVSIIHFGSFKSCHHLQELHLENNDLTSFKLEITRTSLLIPITVFLQNNSISRLEEIPYGVSNIKLDLQNDCSSISHITNSWNELTVMNLENNKIESLKSSALYNVSQIHRINLSNNAIRTVGRLEMSQSAHLWYFHLENNCIETIESEAFTQFSELMILDLQKNRIKNLEGLEFSGLGNLESLILGNNVIETIHELTFRNRKNLKLLNLENNRIKVVQVRLFQDLVSLQKLNLLGNDITNLNAKAFHHLNNLTILRLNNCNIKQISGEFKNLNSLQQLYLNDHLLSTLKRGIFQELYKLETLHLHTNCLIRVAFMDFANLNFLKILTLNNNKLNSPNVWELPRNLRFLNITNNSFTCDCQFMVEFRRWLTEMRDSKLNFTSSSLTCSNEVNEKTAVLTFDLSLCRVTYELVLGLCAGVVFLLFLVVSALYYWRTEVQVWVYSRFGVRLFYKAEEDNGKMFDVFISFSSDDARFVVQELVPGLKDYKVCVHYKHFPAGAYIADAIVDAVAQSRRTLLVFSENFMKSPYCKFEFRAAHHKSLEDRCCRLIVLLLEDVDEKNMDPEQKAYFRTNTYLRWDDPAFWRKLSFALPNVQAAESAGQSLMGERQITGGQAEEQV